MEIVIAIIIVAFAIYMLCKNIKKSAEGKCTGCSSSSANCSSCPMHSNRVFKENQ